MKKKLDLILISCTLKEIPFWEIFAKQKCSNLFYGNMQFQILLKLKVKTVPLVQDEKGR